MSQARVLVEVDVSVEHPKQIWLGSQDNGAPQTVLIENLPLFCSACKRMGHVLKDCRSTNFSQPCEDSIAPPPLLHPSQAAPVGGFGSEGLPTGDLVLVPVVDGNHPGTTPNAACSISVPVLQECNPLNAGSALQDKASDLLNPPILLQPAPPLSTAGNGILGMEQPIQIQHHFMGVGSVMAIPSISPAVLDPAVVVQVDSSGSSLYGRGAEDCLEERVQCEGGGPGAVRNDADGLEFISSQEVVQVDPVVPPAEGDPFRAGTTEPSALLIGNELKNSQVLYSNALRFGSKASSPLSPRKTRLQAKLGAKGGETDQWKLVKGSGRDNGPRAVALEALFYPQGS